MITLVLRHRFIFQPPLLSSAINPFVGLKHTAALFNLAREFTPEEYEKLVRMTPADAAIRFARLFSERYFSIIMPSLNSWNPDRERVGQDMVSAFVSHLPVQWYGLRSYDYDNGRLRPGHQLAAALCVCPFGEEDGARVSIIDRFQHKAPAAAKLLPSRGWRLEQIEEALLDEPAYPGLLEKCRWLFGRTGNVWLDNVGGREAGMGSWSRENVDVLTADWPSFQEMDRKMKNLDAWLGHDFPGRSRDIIRHLKKKIGKTLAEIFAEDTHGSQD